MKFNKALTNILNSKSKVDCLRLLCNHPTAINGRQLSKIIGLSPMTVHKAMKELAKEQVVLLKNYGNSHIYAINEEGVIVQKILKPMFKEERVLLQDLVNTISKKINISNVKNKIYSVALFGSVNDGSEEAGSDVDICVIVDKFKDKKTVENLLFDINSEVMPHIGMRIEPYIKTIREFKMGKALGVIKSILQRHRLIYGNNLDKIR